MRTSTALPALVAAALGTTASANLISEFEPNPAGADPATTPIELSGTPGAAFSGFLTFIDTDAGGALGGINSSDAVSGTYDANGLAVVTLGFNVENPSFTLVFSSLTPTDNVDANGDRLLDDASVFGTAFDAVGIIDDVDDTTDFAAVLGGQTFSTPSEFEIVFRDGVTGTLFGVDTPTGDVFDTTGTLFSVTDFTPDAGATTFGAVNPTVPEPASLALVGLGGLAVIGRRRRG